MVGVAVAASIFLWACAREPRAIPPSARTPGADNPAPSAQDKAEATGANFVLELVVPRAQVALGEPVHLFAVLENVSKSERAVRDLLDTSYGFLRVRLRHDDDERESALVPLVHREGRGRRPQMVKPGEQLEAPIAVFAGRDGWLLDRPGTYWVTAEFSFEEGTVAASPARIEVIAPATDSERKAAALMMQRDAAEYLLLGGGDGRGEGRALLEQVEREHPESPHAPYAQLALARADVSESFDSKTSVVRPARPEDAAARVQAALPRVQDPVFAVVGIETLVNGLRQLGRGGEAEKALQTFTEQRGSAIGTRSLLERVKALEGHAEKRSENEGRS